MNHRTSTVLTALLLAVAACAGSDANKNGSDLTDLTAASYTIPATASVEVSPNVSAIQIGRTVKLATNVVGNDGHALEGLSGLLARWVSSDTTIAIVSVTGLVKGLRDGTVTIRAVAANHTASSTIKVGSGQDSTPVTTTPVTTTPVDTPPATSTPVTTPPATTPPATTPPATTPPATTPPATTPPATTPPATTPPATTPPATTPPATTPPATTPVTDPPVTTPPVVKTPTPVVPPLPVTTPPPATTPPVTTPTPPVTTPPVTTPPVTTPPVTTAPVTPATGQGLSGMSLSSDDFSRYASTTDLQSNITKSIGGTGSTSSLYSDGHNPALAEIDKTVLYNGHATMKFNQPGGTYDTPQLAVRFPHSSTHIWYRVKVRFSPGFTTAGTTANSANAYKLLSWGWDGSGLDGSGRVEITNTTQFEIYENVQTGGGVVGGGNYIMGPNISSEWSDGGWYDYIVEVDHSTAKGVVRFWRGKDGQSLTYVGQQPETMKSGGLMPALTGITVGLNFNQTRAAGKSQALWWGQWEVVDGTQHANPFGMSAQ